MRVAWQMAATHEHNIHTGVNRVLESVKSLVVPRLLILTYYSAAVARRYLKSDISNTNVPRRRRRMSCESLTVGFLLLFEEPPSLESHLPCLYDSSRTAFALRFIRVEHRFELSLLGCDRSGVVSRWWIKPAIFNQNLHNAISLHILVSFDVVRFPLLE